MNVTVWNEYILEQDPDHLVRTVYLDGIHITIAEARTATQDQPEHGLTADVPAARCIRRTLPSPSSG